MAFIVPWGLSSTHYGMDGCLYVSLFLSLFLSLCVLVCRKDAKAAICYRLPVTVCSFVCLQKAVLLIIYERIPMMVMVCCSFAFSHFLHSSFCDLPKRYGAIRQNVAFHQHHRTTTKSAQMYCKMCRKWNVLWRSLVCCWCCTFF